LLKKIVLTRLGECTLKKKKGQKGVKSDFHPIFSKNFKTSSQMAPKKLFAKRARKATTGERSSAAPQAKIEFDGHRFQSEEHQCRFEVIKD